MRTFLLAAVLALCAFGARAQDDVDVLYVFSDGQIPVTLDAYKRLIAERPDLAGRVDIKFLTESMFDDTPASVVADTDVLVLDIMNQGLVDRFNEAHGTDLIQDVGARGKVVAIGAGLQPKETYIEQGAIWDERARELWANPGRENQLGLLKFALGVGGIAALSVPDPIPSLDFGYYYPSSDGGRVFADWASFDAWRSTNGKTRPGAPRVAIGFYKAAYYTGDTATLDAVIAEVEHQGGEAIPLFGYPGGVAYERLLLDEEGRSRADVGLGFLFRFAGPEAADSLGKLDFPVVNLITLYGRSEKEWLESTTGLSMFEGTFQTAVPELAGLVAPTVVGSREKVLDLATGVPVVTNRPIAERVSAAVARGLRYAALSRKPNADKHVALIYYNYPPGKSNIGASYLNVAESLANALQRMRAEGYDVGDADLSADAVLEEITTKARNVGGYAPGELAEMLATGGAALVPVSEYRQWLAELAPKLRDKTLADWGPPEDSKLMTTEGDTGPALVVPLVRYGNVVLLPQPARGWGEDADKLYHAKDLTPHHQYFATYAWLAKSFGADAVVHFGTHGTLEWLDGKDVGQSPEDASDALIADLPDLYIYNVDVVGEGLVARRRGMAALVDHMVPPFTPGGLYPELARLSEQINDYDQNLHKNPELAVAFADEIRSQTTALGIAKDLGLDLAGGGNLDDETVHRIQDYVLELKGEQIPYGLHAFGRVPKDEERASTVEAIVAADRSLLPTDAKVLAADMDARIVTSANRELDNLLRGLDGGFVGVGGGGEPIRNPDAYPTGKNFFGIDPEKVPKKASWALGVKLADQMLADHLAKHGRYPEKVSFVIWGDETMRHEGVLEAQIFHLLGTRPVWNDRDKVVDVEVVPSRELGRPRVDIVIASAAPGLFTNVTLLIDKAVQQVKAIDEAENYVRRHYLATKRALIDAGYDEDQADRRAGVRIFDEPPGVYNLNTSRIAEASGTWDSDVGLGDDYLRKIGHAFGNGFWGEPMEDVFRLALSGTEKIVHSSSTMLYGALDNDDFYMYMGGLASAVRNVDGQNPELVVTNTRDPSNPKMSTIDEFIGKEFRSRYVNPTWIEGMKKEGYAGAGAMREFVEYLWGWDATVTETIDDAMWQETFAVYVEDKHELGLEEFFDEESPFAYQDITARMIETVRKGYWQAGDETLTTLLTEYIESVAEHGVGCSDHTCGNPRLLEYVVEQALARGVPAPAVRQFVDAMEQAIGGSVAELAAAARQFVAANEAAIANRVVPGAESVSTTQSVEAAELQGYLLESVRQDAPAQEQPAAAQPQPRRDGAAARPEVGSLVVSVALLLLLFAWRAWRLRGPARAHDERVRVGA